MPSERVTQAAAARRLGISKQALGKWATRPGAPVVHDAGQLLCLWPEFPRWREAERDRTSRAEQRPRSLEVARARLTAARAEREELSLRRERGELMTVAEWERALSDAYARVRSKLLALPNIFATRVVGETVAERVAQAQEVVDEVMRELAAAEDVPLPDEGEDA